MYFILFTVQDDDAIDLAIYKGEDQERKSKDEPMNLAISIKWINDHSVLSSSYHIHNVKRVHRGSYTCAISFDEEKWEVINTH